MTQNLRANLLAVAAALMLFNAGMNAYVLMPDLHGDLAEIGVRPSVLATTVLHLYFGMLAQCGFTVMVVAAAIQLFRGQAAARTPLLVTAAIYVVFGLLAFSMSHSPHHLGPVAMGALIAASAAIP